MKHFSLAQNTSVSFSDYFKSNYEVEEILEYFGYSFKLQRCTLPSIEVDTERVQALGNRIEESLPYLTLNNEMARREFLIAPVLIEVIHHTQAKIKVEFPIEVSEHLKGNLDYYLIAHNHLLVIEAKNADLQRGLLQLAVELLTLDQWTESDEEILYGAVSMGNIWQFAFLHRHNKQITQDLNLYRVPEDLERILCTLVGILT